MAFVCNCVILHVCTGIGAKSFRNVRNPFQAEEGELIFTGELP